MRAWFARSAVVPFLVLLAVVAGVCRARFADDPLQAEIARWSAALRDTANHDELWQQSVSASSPVLAGAELALRQNRRLLALQRLGRARTPLAASLYAREHPEAGKSIAALEAEWKRVGEQVRRDSIAAAPAKIQPAALRAIAEAAAHQSRIHHGASLDYGRNTEPVYGLYYLGVAEAQRENVELYRQLSRPAEGRAPALRSIAAEIDALETELLAAYRPPASIDRHPEFIRASADVKEARELNGLGLRHAALLRYLDGVQKVGLLTESVPPPDSVQIKAELDRFETSIARDHADHTIARLFVEAGRSDPAAPAARVIVTRVLPLYLAAIAPAAAQTPRATPALAVTLVRWPFT